jgi:hypothetical protein
LLKIAEVKKLLVSSVATPLAECGYVRLGQKMIWRKAEPESQQTIEFQFDKYGWDRLLGSKFTLNFEEKSFSPEIQSRGDRLGYLLEGHVLLGQIKNLNQKIIHDFPQSPVLTMLQNTASQVGVKTESSNLTGEDIWLGYYKQEHVQWWCSFFTASLPTIIHVWLDRIESPIRKARNRYNDHMSEIQLVPDGFERLSRSREIVLKFLLVEKDENNIARANEMLRSIDSAIGLRIKDGRAI